MTGRFKVEVGGHLGPYRLIDLLGKGGMGEVYRAYDSRLDRQVAVKVILHSAVQDHERTTRFAVEARAAAALNHPNIMAIYDVGSHDGVAYLVSELLRGETSLISWKLQARTTKPWVFRTLAQPNTRGSCGKAHLLGGRFYVYGMLLDGLP